MHFLKPPPVMRTPSTEEFVVEEDRSDGESSPPSYNNSPAPQSTPWEFPKIVPQTEARVSPKLLLAVLTVTCVTLCIALTIFAVLYCKEMKEEHNEVNYSTEGVVPLPAWEDPRPHYDVCKTKTCKLTAFRMMQHIDESVDPCEDFQNFACGSWLTETATTAQGPQDHTTSMREIITAKLTNLVRNITNDYIEPLRQAKLLYNTCMDTASIDERGVTPLLDLLNDLVYKNRNESLAKLIARTKKITGQSYLFDISLSSDYRDSTINAIFIDQSQLPLQGSMILEDEFIQEKYKKLVTEAFYQLAEDPASVPVIRREAIRNISQLVLDLEKQMAEEMADYDTISKPSMFHLFTLRDLNRIYSTELKNSGGSKSDGVQFDWVELMTELFSGLPNVFIDEDTHVIVNDLNYIKAVGRILATSTRHEMDAYLSWRMVFQFGKFVSKDFSGLLHDFHDSLFGGESSSRLTMCINVLDVNMPFALSYPYVLKYVPDRLITGAEEMVKNLRKAFKSRVRSLSWMDKNTRHRALMKAEKMRVFIGYPKWLKNDTALIHYYQGLFMTKYNFFQNILIVKQWETRQNLEQINLPVDMTWTSVSPVDANAFYDEELNAITFPSGFLQSPFFGLGLRSLDYGALGSVIGHEITHGFDMSGRYSDENGRLNSWWSMPTLFHFLSKAQCFVDQYEMFKLPELEAQLGDKNHLNGRKTRNENIADNGGIREAYNAYQYYVQSLGKPEQRLPELEQYTPDQLFFLSFAQSACAYNNPESLLESIYTNEHSPSRYRIIGPLQNFDVFSKVWKCEPGSFMNPKDKCVLW